MELNQNFMQAYYITTARELARMVGIRKAPILHHFSESIAGAATIRCFNQEERFLMRSLSLIDDYSRIVFHNSGTMEWLCIRINFLFNLGFFLVLIILVNLPKSAIDPSELLLSHIFSDPTSRETIHTNLQPRIFGTL
jgi:ABC-type multidrug transport system fused ATPase/permease subunit